MDIREFCVGVDRHWGVRTRGHLGRDEETELGWDGIGELKLTLEELELFLVFHDGARGSTEVA